jgi:hypothetical protein
MGELFASLLLGAVEWILVLTGKAIVAVVTLGRWRGEHLTKSEAHVYGPAGALSFKREGQRVITATGMLLVGVLFYLALGVVLLWLAS